MVEGAEKEVGEGAGDVEEGRGTESKEKEGKKAKDKGGEREMVVESKEEKREGKSGKSERREKKGANNKEGGSREDRQAFSNVCFVCNAIVNIVL